MIGEKCPICFFPPQFLLLFAWSSCFVWGSPAECFLYHYKVVKALCNKTSDNKILKKSVFPSYLAFRNEPIDPKTTTVTSQNHNPCISKSYMLEVGGLGCKGYGFVMYSFLCRKAKNIGRKIQNFFRGAGDLFLAPVLCVTKLWPVIPYSMYSLLFWCKH